MIYTRIAYNNYITLDFKLFNEINYQPTAVMIYLRVNGCF